MNEGNDVIHQWLEIICEELDGNIEENERIDKEEGLKIDQVSVSTVEGEIVSESEMRIDR